MYHTFLTLLALSPIALILGLVYGNGMASRHAVPIGWGVTCLIALFFWQMDFFQILAATAKGLFIAVELMFFLIIAIVLGRAFRESHASAIIRESFARINPDRRVQAILIGCLFGPGIDSILGFGAGTGVPALLMAGIGFPPACAVLVAVMGMVPASAFTLMGTPVVYGVAGGLQDPAIIAQLQASGMDLPTFLRLVTVQAGFMNGLVGIFQPLLMVMTMTRFFGRTQTWTEGISIAPFALFSGLVFSVPYIFTAAFLGPEFPPLVGALVGLVIVVTAVRFGFLIPNDHFEFIPNEEWRSDWSAGFFKPQGKIPMPLWRAWFPYIFTAALLAASRTPAAKELLKKVTALKLGFLEMPAEIFFQILYMPSIMHIVVIVVCIAAYPVVRDHFHAGTSQMFVPIASIFRKFPFAAAMACVYMYSSVNNSGLPGMPRVITDWFAQLPGSQIWCAFLSPFIGAVAIFSPESSMFSNFELSTLQYHLGQSLALSPSLFVALQVAGSSAGSMIAFNYIAGAGVYLGMLGWESPTFRRVLSPFLIYLTTLGLLGVLFANFWHIPPSLLPKM